MNSSEIKNIELYIDKKRLLFINFVFLVLSYLLAMFVDYFFNEIGTRYILITAPLIYAVLTYSTWPFFFKTPHLKITPNGLEVRGLGYRDWISIKTGIVGRTIWVAYDGIPSSPTFDPKKIYCKKYREDKKTNRVFVTFWFPYASTNMCLKEFFKHIDRQSIQETLERFFARHRKLTWRTHILGSEKPTFAQVTFNLLLMVYVVFFGYGFYAHSFFPSEIWGFISRVICWSLTSILSIFMVRAYISGKANFSHISKRKGFRIIALMMMPVPVFMMLWIGCLGAGKLAGEVWGTQQERVISVNKRSNDGYSEACLESDDLDTNMFQTICVKRPLYKKLPRRSRLKAHGTVSWFGFNLKDSPEKIND